MSLFNELIKIEKAKCRALGKKFELEEWNKLEENKKIQRIDELSCFLCENLKIKNKPKIEIIETSDTIAGSYSRNKNRIIINKKILSSGGILTAVTLAHEIRHSYQNEIVKAATTIEKIKYKSQIELRIDFLLANINNTPWRDWKNNFENYVTEGEEYFTQPIEDDAFYYEGHFLKQFFVD